MLGLDLLPPAGLTCLASAPGELGLARACISGDLEPRRVHLGDPYNALKSVPDWRWMMDRADSPWYPSLRLYRPRAEGDWDHVFDAASADLMNLAKV